MGGYFAETRIGPLLSRFAFDHPKVRLTVDLNSHNVSLTSRGFDLAIRAGPLEPSGLIGRRLTGFRFVTLGAPSLLDTVGSPTLPDHLDPALCLSLGGRDWTFKRGKQRQTLQPTGRYVANSGTLLIGAAVIGAGFVQVPAYYGLAEVASGTLVPLLEAWTDDDDAFEFHIVYAPQRHLPLRVRALIDFLVGEIKQR